MGFESNGLDLGSERLKVLSVFLEAVCKGVLESRLFGVKATGSTREQEGFAGVRVGIGHKPSERIEKVRKSLLLHGLKHRISDPEIPFDFLDSIS